MTKKWDWSVMWIGFKAGLLTAFVGVTIFSVLASVGACFWYEDCNHFLYLIMGVWIFFAMGNVVYLPIGGAVWLVTAVIIHRYRLYDKTQRIGLALGGCLSAIHPLILIAVVLYYEGQETLSTYFFEGITILFSFLFAGLMGGRKGGQYLYSRLIEEMPCHSAAPTNE